MIMIINIISDGATAHIRVGYANLDILKVHVRKRTFGGSVP